MSRAVRRGEGGEEGVSRGNRGGCERALAPQAVCRASAGTPQALASWHGHALRIGGLPAQPQVDALAQGREAEAAGEAGQRAELHAGAVAAAHAATLAHPIPLHLTCWQGT